MGFVAGILPVGNYNVPRQTVAERFFDVGQVHPGTIRTLLI